MSVKLRVDWPTLRAVARQAAARAHCPYSNLAVGAAGATNGDRIVTGCNVENASYGLTLCAECGLVSDVMRSGATSLLAVSIVDGDGVVMMPCGRCRQLLHEVGGPDLMVDATPDPVRLATLLPRAFDRADLPENSLVATP